MQRGIATLELLIALGVLTLILSGIVLISFGSQTVALDTEVASRALLVTNTQLQRALKDISEGVLPPLTLQESIFSTETEIRPVSECLTDVLVTTRWWQDRIRPQDMTVVGTVVHDDIIDAYGGDCDVERLAVDAWNTPEVVASVSVAPRATDIDVVRRDDRVYAFVSVSNTSTTSPDLFVFDVTNPTGFSGALDTFDVNEDNSAGATEFIFPMTRLDVVGDRAYVGSGRPDPTFLVVSVDTPSDLGPLLALTDVPVGDDDGVQAVAYYDGFVHVGTEPAQGPELSVFEIVDPLFNDPPVLRGRVPDLFTHSIFDLSPWRNVVYVAPSATRADTCELIVLDMSALYSGSGVVTIHNPCPPGGGGDSFVYRASGEISSESVFSGFGTTFIGRRRAGDDHEVYILDTFDHEHITPRGSFGIPLATKDDKVTTLALRGDALVLTTTDEEHGVELWDVRDMSQPLFVSRVITEGPVIGAEVFEGRVYALLATTPSSKIIIIEP